MESPEQSFANRSLELGHVSPPRTGAPEVGRTFPRAKDGRGLYAHAAPKLSSLVMGRVLYDEAEGAEDAAAPSSENGAPPVGYVVRRPRDIHGRRSR